MVDQRFRLAAPGVVADIIDGEAIIMNLNRGAYYSLVGAGARAWQMLVDGATCEEAARVIAAAADADAAVLAGELAALAARCEEEGLLTPAPDRPAPELPAIDALAYAAPALDKYGDMSEMLALDPPIPEFNG